MSDAGNHLSGLSEAAAAFDVPTLIDEARKASQDAKEAVEFLDVAPSWSPGDRLVADT